jgi:hypothetical protein
MIAAIGQMLGSIAVFVTLGYLSVQVRHARSAMRRSIARDRLDRFIQIGMPLVTDERLAALHMKINEALVGEARPPFVTTAMQQFELTKEQAFSLNVEQSIRCEAKAVMRRARGRSGAFAGASRALALSLAIMGLAARAHAGSLQLTPLQPTLPAQVIDLAGNVMFQNPTYQSFHRPPFGSPCRICATDVIQGALNDCSLLSAIAAVATASPGTIERAVTAAGQKDANDDDIYLVQYFQNGAAKSLPIASSFPAQTLSLGDKWYSNIRQRGYVWSPLTPFFVYAQLPSKDESALSLVFNGMSDSTWPMLMEKAYVAMVAPGGYGDKNLYDKGFDPAVTLTHVTGVPTKQYDVKAVTGSSLASVWVHDSPSVANVGGHSVILGLLRGTMKAIEPNLRVCVAPANTQQGACAPVCRESHECRGALSQGLPLAHGAKVRVQVTDINRPGDEHEVATFDVDPSQCTDKSPCTVSVPANQWVLAGNLVISFGVASDPLLGLDALLSDIQTHHRASIVGTVWQTTGCPANDVICAQLFEPVGSLEWGHAYYLRGYKRFNGPVKDNSVMVGNPHGGGLPPPLTLEQFYHAFIKIYDNETKHEASQCTCN